MGTLRPQSWVVLHDLVFDAEWVDNRWVAPSSAQLVAEHLRIDAGTAATALRQLRDCGIAELSSEVILSVRYGRVRDDIETTGILPVVGVVVGQYRRGRGGNRAAVEMGRSEIRRIRRLAELVAYRARAPMT